MLLSPSAHHFAYNHMAPHDQDDESDTYSMVSDEDDYYTPSVGTSVTSHDWEMRSASPAPSVYSMTSSLRAASYRHEFGRGINNHSEIYHLPADDEEFERLDKQHVMFIDVMGKFPPPVLEVLADDTPGVTKTCADLGCGSGSWILDIAREFPNSSCVAVDLVPMQDVNMPVNCRSEVDDINLGLHHFYGELNVVHARLVSSGIRDYHGLIDEMAQTLRPRGLLEVTEFDFRVYDTTGRPIMPDRIEEETPWIARWMNTLNIAVERRGGEPDAANHLDRWCSTHPMLEEVVHSNHWFQISPWKRGCDPASLRDNRIGCAMRDDILSFLKSARPLLLGYGLNEAFVDELESNAERELLESRVQGYIRVQDVYARRRAY